MSLFKFVRGAKPRADYGNPVVDALCDLATMADCCHFAAAPAGMPHLCARTFAPLTGFRLISACSADLGYFHWLRRLILMMHVPALHDLEEGQEDPPLLAVGAQRAC